MTNNIDSEVVKKIKALYASDENAKTMFDLLANRRRDIWATTIDWVMRELGLWRGDAVGLLQKLDGAGCGTMFYGRRGAKTRIEWSFSCISIGQAAAGEVAELENADDPITEEEYQAEEAIQAELPQMTIARAKEMLALSLGVRAENIEISIRA